MKFVVFIFHPHPNPSFDPVYGKPNQTVGIKGEAGRPFTLIKWIGRPRQCLYCAPNHQCQGQGGIFQCQGQGGIFYYLLKACVLTRPQRDQGFSISGFLGRGFAKSRDILGRDLPENFIKDKYNHKLQVEAGMPVYIIL